MEDAYGRVIDYIRISVTDRCNLRCVYCMPEEGVVSVAHTEILSYDELIRLCEIFVSLGITRVKLTGGEPLVRRNIESLIGSMNEISEIVEITLTTNGILLEDKIEKLVMTGIKAVNISLDTLDEHHYAEITRGGDLNRVLTGIEELMKYPEIMAKINCVPNNICDEEILEIARMAETKNLHVRFIELMPIGVGKMLVGDCKVDQSYNQEERIKKLLEREWGRLTQNDDKLGNGPSHYYNIEGFRGSIGFISAMSHKFCGNCNRVRLTAEGFLKTCLQYETGIDLRGLLRNGESDEVIREAIKNAIEKKPKEHEFLNSSEGGESKSMFQIGG